MSAVSPPVEPPRFCPRCDRPAAAQDPLCRSCGDPTAPQGYCDVCEAYVAARVGADCPKHDVPLGDAPPHAPAGGPRPDWATVARFGSVAHAMGPRLRLEAEGIPTFLDGQRMATNIPNHPAVGGVRLQVPRPMLADARVLLDQSWEPPPGEDLDDAWEDLAPEPGARRRAIMKAAIVLILALPWLVALLGLFFR